MVSCRYTSEVKHSVLFKAGELLQVTCRDIEDEAEARPAQHSQDSLSQHCQLRCLPHSRFKVASERLRALTVRGSQNSRFAHTTKQSNQLSLLCFGSQEKELSALSADLSPGISPERLQVTQPMTELLSDMGSTARLRFWETCRNCLWRKQGHARSSPFKLNKLAQIRKTHYCKKW